VYVKGRVLAWYKQGPESDIQHKKTKQRAKKKKKKKDTISEGTKSQ
jgi:hypothetical protein